MHNYHVLENFMFVACPPLDRCFTHVRCVFNLKYVPYLDCAFLNKTQHALNKIIYGLLLKV